MGLCSVVCATYELSTFTYILCALIHVHLDILTLLES